MIVTLLALLCVFAAEPLQAQIIRQELAIPMRDGATIAGDLYSTDTTAGRPMILIQTPYNKNLYRLSLGLGIGGVVPYEPQKYHYVITDWRGFYGSKDAASAGYDRGLDGFDIMQWLGSRTWCNGDIGTWGGSALGMIQFQTARHHPPQYVCAVPLIKDFKTKYNDYYYGGVLRREHVETLERLGFIAVSLVTSHPTRDVLWTAAENASDVAGEVAIPMLLASGWFDHYPDDVLRAFADLRTQSDIDVRDEHRLIMGPWTHMDVDKENVGELAFPDAVYTARDAALEFFAYHLLGAKNGWPLTPTVRFYELGGGWERAPSWESAAGVPIRMYMHESGTLSSNPPDEDGGQRSVRSDPAAPVPSHGGARFNPFDQTVQAGPLDINPVVLTHDDILLFESSAFNEPLRIRGSMHAELFVSTSANDADVSVRLCEVYPDGRRIIISEGIRRLRFREGFTEEQEVFPGAVYALHVSLQDISWRIPPGHRLAVVIAGSSYPRFDINPNNGGPLYQPGDSVSATLTLYAERARPSSIVMQALQPTSHMGTPEIPGSGIEVRAWPQPYDGRSTLHVSTRSDGHRVQLALVDVLGRTIHQFPDLSGIRGTSQRTWQPQRALPAGVYMLRAATQTLQHVVPLIVR